VGLLIREIDWLEISLSQSQGDGEGACPSGEPGCGGQRPQMEACSTYVREKRRHVGGRKGSNVMVEIKLLCFMGLFPFIPLNCWIILHMIKSGRFWVNWGIKPKAELSAAQEAFLSFHFSTKRRSHHTTYREVLTRSQGSTEYCIAVRSSAAVTGWTADGGFVWDIAVVCGTG
jgi:hypothetical protein